MRERKLTHQIVIRVDDELLDAIDRYSKTYGRTRAQTVRFWLRAMARAAQLADERSVR